MNSTPWLAYRRQSPLTRMRLFCFPYAGGGGSMYRNWPHAMPDDVECCLVQPPGRERRLSEPCLTDLRNYTQQAASALAPFFDLPFAFFGYSLGALAAYELARQLRRQDGPQPVCLFAAAHRAPDVPRSGSNWSDLPEAELVQKLQNIGGTPAEVLQSDELRRLLLPIIRADFQLIENYSYQTEPPLACPITALGGEQDTNVPKWKLEAWREHTTGSFATEWYEGGHFFIKTHEPQIIKLVTDTLQSN